MLMRTVFGNYTRLDVRVVSVLETPCCHVSRAIVAYLWTQQRSTSLLVETEPTPSESAGSSDQQVRLRAKTWICNPTMEIGWD